MLGVLHMGVLEDVPDFVRDLIAVCRSVGCSIRAVLLDREFFSTRVFEALEKMGVGYLVPCKNTDVVVGAIAEFAAGRRPAVSELYITNADGVSVRYTIIITERKKRRKKKQQGKVRRCRSPSGGGVHRVCHQHAAPGCRTVLQEMGHRDGIPHDRGDEGPHAQHQCRVQDILLFVFCGDVQCVGDDKRNALCRVQTCRKDKETHDTDAAANRDNSSACPARTAL